MSTSVRKTLCDLRKQIRTGKSLNGFDLSEEKIEKFRVREQELAEQQEDHAEQLTHTTAQADRVISKVFEKLHFAQVFFDYFTIFVAGSSE